MAHEIASISLLEHLAEAGYRSSVIATYSCYFPFYEEVVLRRLIAAGCTHNVLMADAIRCAEAFASDDLRPHRAGRDYTLIPVRVGGAFHPKMVLRLGESRGSLLVGSHNVTLSGFGLNDEITNAFRVEGASLRSTGGLLRQAFDYLSGFLPSGLSDVVEAYEGVKHGIPWMEGPLGTGDASRALLTSSSSGSDLWSQIAPLIPEEVSTAYLSGPFFDHALAFVRRLQNDVRPGKLVIGIDPESVEVDPAEAASLVDAQWVNVAGIPQIPQRREGSSHYPHAKVLWFAGKKEELLITGSANPSVAAFFAASSGRNAEAVVADRRAGAGNEIGIEALLGAPTITDADWSAVATRRASKPTPEESRGRRIVMASPTHTGFRTGNPLPLGLVLRGVGDNSLVLGEAVVRDATTLEASDIVRDGARYLDTEWSDERVLVLVHRTEDIARNLGGDTRKALRQALGAFEEDPSQLEALLKLTEKVIFDSDDIVRSTPVRAGVPLESSKDPQVAPASLAIDAAGRRSARRKQKLASGDILVLLDALMRRLGEGLPTSSPPRPPNDQDEIGADEEDGGELARDIPNFQVLAKACRGKARRLIRRMLAQLELAGESGNARRGIIQLAAVLCVIRTLRRMGLRSEWRRMKLEVVDRDDERRLFEEAVLAVAWGKYALAPRAFVEAGGEWFEELSMVISLLAWLAWDLGVDVDAASGRSGFQNVEHDSWYDLQLIAALGPWLAGDEDAVNRLQESVEQTPRPRSDGERWVRLHLELADAFAKVAVDPDRHGLKGRNPRPGDLVVLSNTESPRVRVVLDVRPSAGDSKVVFFDPEGDDGQRAFLSSRVATLPWTPAPASSTVSA